MNKSILQVAIVITVLSALYTGTLCAKEGASDGTSASRSDIGSQQDPANHELQYYYNLGWREDYYDDDDAFHDGYQAGGTLTIYVNDSPVSMYSRNGQIFRLSSFLKPGKNTIRITGKHSKRIWLKVMLASPGEMLHDLKSRKAVAKMWLEPEKESSLLLFDAGIAKSPEFEDLPINANGRAAMESELRVLFKRMLGACVSHDPDAFLQCELPEINAPPEYLKSRKQLLKFNDRIEKMVRNRKYTLLTKVSDLKSIYGARSVVLYSGDIEGSPYLLNFDTGKENWLAWMDAITLVRIGGKWTEIEEGTRFPLSFGL